MPLDLAPNTTVEVERPLAPTLVLSPPVVSVLAVETLPGSTVAVKLPGVPELVMGSPPESVVAVLPMAGPPGPAGTVTTHTHTYSDLTGSVPSGALPGVAITNFIGSVATQVDMLALSGQRGDWATRSDLGTDWTLIGDDPSILANWRQTTYPVTSVASKTGAVSLVKGDVGLGNVDNTSDANKPVSTAQAAALVAKATLTTKGDLFVATGSGTIVRFPVSATDNQTILSDATQSSGIKWGAPPAGAPSGAAGGDLTGTYPNPTIRTSLNDPVAATAGLRTLGTGAQQACAGNDSRLSDARTPTSHTHAESDVSSLVSDLASKVPTSRQVLTSSKMTGGGALSADITLDIAAGGIGGTEIASAIKDPSAGVAGLRTLGTSSTQAAAGNHTHSTLSVPVVSSTGSVSSPYTGMIVFVTTDNMLYRYTGSAWVAFLATGGNTSATMHEVRYAHKTTMNFTTSTDTKIKFETAVYSCSDVTVSGTGNTDFLLTRAGVWRVFAGLRYNGNAGGGERHIFIQTGTTFDTTKRIASQTAVNVGSAPVTVSCGTEFRVAANTSVFAAGWQNSGATVGSDVGFGETAHIALTWDRPL